MIRATSLDDIGLSPPAMAEVAAWADAHRISGLTLHTLIDRGLDADANVFSEVRDRYREATVIRMRVERIALDVAELLDSAGIEWRVLKGLASGALLYSEPSLREIGDADFFVRPEHLPKALDLLRAQGADLEPFIYIGPAHRAALPGPTVRWRGVDIDFHTYVTDLTGRARIGADLLLNRPMTVDVGEGRLVAPSIECQLLHAAFHYSMANRRLSALCDLALFSCIPGLDLDELRRIDELSGRSRYARWSLESAAHLTMAQTAEGWLTPRPAPKVTAVVAEHPGLTLVLAAGGVSGAVRRVREVIWPSSEFLAMHSRGRLAHVARLVNRRRPTRSTAQP